MVSRITHFGVKNFLTIKQAIVEFDDTNIISLVGYNDSGKSSFTRAIEVLFYDSYKNDQVKCIHRGASTFEIFALFDDGVRIGKIKHNVGTSVWEMQKDGKVVYTNKRDNGIITVEGVPKPIQDYLGVIEEQETKQKLNVRRNTDKLFLVGTSGGENYKMITKVLNIEVLNEAVKMINADRTTLMNKVASTNSMINILRQELNTLDVVQSKAVMKLADLADKAEGLNNAKSVLTYMNEYAQEVKNIVVHDELNLVDTGILQAVEEAKGYLDTLNEPIAPEVSTVDMRLVTTLEGMKESMDVINKPNIPELTVFDTTLIDSMGQLKGYLTDIGKPIQDELHTVDTSLINNLDTMKESLEILQASIHDEVAVVDTTLLSVLDNTREYIETLRTVVQPEVNFNDNALHLLEVMETVKANLVHYKQVSRDLEDAEQAYEEVIKEIQQYAQVENVTICKNCGLLAV